MASTAPQFRSQTAFIFATAAAAIGLGNIWRFPYLAGIHGGGAFVLLYVFFVLVLGIPLMASEMFIGRTGGQSPYTAFAHIAKSQQRSHHWRYVGLIAMLSSLLILSYYLVISGWVLDYSVHSARDYFYHMSAHQAQQHHQQLLLNPGRMILSDTLLTGVCIGILLLGIEKGLERTVLVLFPLFIVLMITLLVVSMFSHHFLEAVRFLFAPHFEKITAHVVLLALGQAFFSLNIGMGIVIVFSAYLPQPINQSTCISAVIASDTAIALLAGLIIFPIVFSHQLTPAAGPSLIFLTLPVALGHLPYGTVIGTLFFVLLLLAAFTSALSLLEVVIAGCMAIANIKRTTAVWLLGGVAWLLSLMTIASFSHPTTWHIFGMHFFQAFDGLTSNVLLPLGGLLTAIFCGWRIPPTFIAEKMQWNRSSTRFTLWRISNRYVAPILISIILLATIKGI